VDNANVVVTCIGDVEGEGNSSTEFTLEYELPGQ
jgi:hypothetical protein